MLLPPVVKRSGTALRLTHIAAWTSVIAATLFTPSHASAQWVFSVYGGVNYTVPATVSVEAPSQGVSIQFHDVNFSAKPFGSPQYFGGRLGRVVARTQKLEFAIEGEYIHLKIYGDTSRTYVTTPGASGGAAGTPSSAAMSATVEQYQMTHGLNYFLGNLVVRAPLHGTGPGSTALEIRGGVGPTMPHGETSVLGERHAQYEYGGMGLQAALGIEVGVLKWLGAFGEYKLTFARPEITLAHGTGRMNATTHQFAFGAAIHLTR